MSNVNKIFLVGYLGRDPELLITPKGHTVVTLSLATTKRYKTAAGEKKEETNWHRAKVWGKTGDNCVKYLTKGSRVYIEGELKMKDWKDKAGNARKSAEIQVDNITFLDGTKPSGSKVDETVGEVAMVQ